MDPHYHNLTPNNSLLSHVFERLIENDEKQNLIPGLAESWKAINDTTWEFKLRKGVKWHDGSPFTADDVVFTFARAGNVPNSPSPFIVAKGKTVTKVDDHTVHISYRGGLSADAERRRHYPRRLQEAWRGRRPLADFNSGKAAIGTGAYKYANFTPGDRIELDAQRRLLGHQAEMEEAYVPPDQGRPGARRGPSGRRRRHDRGHARRPISSA